MDDLAEGSVRQKGTGPLTIDLDSPIVQVHGRAKQGTAFGYTEVRGYHPQLTTCAQTRQVLMCPLRRGTRRHRPRRQVVFDRNGQPDPQRQRRGQLTVRADSAFYCSSPAGRLGRCRRRVHQQSRQQSWRHPPDHPDTHGRRGEIGHELGPVPCVGRFSCCPGRRTRVAPARAAAWCCVGGDIRRDRRDGGRLLGAPGRQLRGQRRGRLRCRAAPGPRSRARPRQPRADPQPGPQGRERAIQGTWRTTGPPAPAAAVRGPAAPHPSRPAVLPCLGPASWSTKATRAWCSPSLSGTVRCGA
jgi:hypothetical protein